MVAGFEEPTEGRILIDGVDVDGRAAVQAADQHRLPELRALPAPERRGQRRLRAAPQGRRQGRGAAAACARSSSASGLAAEAKRKPRQLSGGQQQRVALARALINRPAVLLLDEPLGALDLKLRKGLQVELKRIQRDVGITFVYVTHDQEEALTMSDRIAVMNHGVVEQLDPPEEVYERPRTEFVAGFIGVSNLMPGSVASVERQARSERAPRQRPDGAHAGRRRRAGRAVPRRRAAGEAAGRAGRGAGAGGRPSVEGVVESAVYLGTATQMVVKLAGDVPLTVLVPERRRGRAPAAAGRRRPRAAGVVAASTCTSSRRAGDAPAQGRPSMKNAGRIRCRPAGMSKK